MRFQEQRVYALIISCGVSPFIPSPTENVGDVEVVACFNQHPLLWLLQFLISPSSFLVLFQLHASQTYFPLLSYLLSLWDLGYHHQSRSALVSLRGDIDLLNELHTKIHLSRRKHIGRVLVLSFFSLVLDRSQEVLSNFVKGNGISETFVVEASPFLRGECFILCYFNLFSYLPPIIIWANDFFKNFFFPSLFFPPSKTSRWNSEAQETAMLPEAAWLGVLKELRDGR